jgi:FtsP/CotA-like multicopper oxidase with cupredoxin domain
MAALVGAGALTAALVAIGFLWAQSRLPATYSVMDMGVADLGGGARTESHAGHVHAGMTAPAQERATSVVELSGPRDRAPDVRATLVARQEPVTLPDGRRIDGYTLNGRSPGPTLEAQQGDLVEVQLVNESVPDGVTLHWHGVDVPNAEDGVAGVTQDAVGVGDRHVYRFVAEDSGTYWYHSHNISHEQVTGGLFGVLVIHPKVQERSSPEATDVIAAAHTYDHVLTVNGRSGGTRVIAKPGDRVRLRVVNTDSGPLAVAPVAVPFRVVAIDGRDLSGPDLVENRSVRVPAGGRADLLVVMPAEGHAIRVQIGGDERTGLVLGPSSAADPQTASAASAADDVVDLLSYGTPAPLGLDPDQADRRFVYDIGRRPGFVDGRPGLFWTINGGMFPDVPMFVVSLGDVVRMTISNHSGELHPMHLHGHHAVVLSRNGVAASGSPWWVDSLDVADGETFDIAFVTDNPGIWMDHCHNLPHAAEGLVAHLMYTGVTTPFTVGGAAHNHPE